MEAALISGLVAAGMDKSVAVPAVFLFRLATFWLPILPGWLGFTWLQRHELPLTAASSYPVSAHPSTGCRTSTRCRAWPASGTRMGRGSTTV